MYFVVLWRLRHLLNPQESDLSDAERAEIRTIRDADELKSGGGDGGDDDAPTTYAPTTHDSSLALSAAPSPEERPATGDVGGEDLCNLSCFGGGGGDDGGDDAGFGAIVHVDDAPPAEDAPPGAPAARSSSRQELGAAAPGSGAPAAPDAPLRAKRMSLVVREQRRSMRDQARDQLLATDGV